MSALVDAIDTRLPHRFKVQDLLQLLGIELDCLGLVRVARRYEIGELLGENLEGRCGLLLLDADLSLRKLGSEGRLNLFCLPPVLHSSAAPVSGSVEENLVPVRFAAFI